MTSLLTKAFEDASKLSDIEQNKLARWLLAELESERKWDHAFAESEDLLSQLSDEALEARAQGQTGALDVDKL